VPDDLLARRADYPILERKSAYLVNNSLGAMHRGTRDRLASFAQEWDEQGVAAWPAWFDGMRDIADLVGATIGAEPGTTILRQNVADALVAVASTIEFTGTRNRVVTTAADWPGSHYFWTEHCRRHGGELVVVPHDDDGVSIDTERLLAAIDDRTRVVSVSLVQFRTSAMIDLAAVVEAARRHDALLVLDAYQAAGVVPVRVAELGVDVCLGGSVKYLCGGPGNGWLSIRADLVESMRPSAVGWISDAHPFDFRWSEIAYADGIGRFAGGTPNIPAAYAAQPGYQAIVDVGIEAIRERSTLLTQLLIDASLELGYDVKSPKDAERRGGHVTVDPGDSEHVHDELLSRGFMVDHRPGSGIRIGPHFFNTEDECRAVIAEIGKIRAA
jgi:kynureninase